MDKARIFRTLLAGAWAWAGAAYGEPAPQDRQALVVPAYAQGLSDFRVDIERRRVELSDMAGLMRRLRIGPGMTILDVGAGTGQFSYKFAEAMQGSGRVFATECNDSLVGYMAREGQRRRLGNFSPLFVQRDGVDASYGQHRFDVIFLAHVYDYLTQRVEFMRALRGSLSEHGRLVIVNTDQSPYSENVPDPEGFVRELTALPERDVCRLVLSSATSAALLDPHADARRTAASAVRDFNVAGVQRLGEPGLLLPLIPAGRDRRYARWLLDFGLKHKKPVPVRFIRMIFEARFKGHLVVPVNRSLERIKKELAEAGYRFENCDPAFAPTEFAAVFAKAE